VGWGWLLLSTASRFYLALVGALAACALLPMFFGLSGAVVQSSSMEPHIHTGDVVLSRKLPSAARLPLGRVITFQAPTGSAHRGDVLHRLVAINSNGSLVTKGDANARPDSTPLARRDIISRACILVPWIGLPSYWVGAGAFLPLGIWVLITMAALMIGAVDAASEQPPKPRAPPAEPGPSSGSGKDPENPGECVPQPATQPQGASIPSVVSRFRHTHGPNPAGLVAMLSVAAMAMAPLGVAGAAFSSTTGSSGNSWATSGPATKLAFTTSPSSSIEGFAFDRQPVVAVQDAGGSTVGTSSAPVTLSITTPAGAILTCTANPRSAVAGVATFAGCKIDLAGTYTLTATSGTLTSAVSASFTIEASAATKLAFTTNPSGSTGGVAFATQPVVTVQDASGNTVTTSIASVDLSITTPAGATLSCAEDPKSAVSGVATFAGCKVDKSGTYTLTAVSSGLTNAVSTSFTITVGAAIKLGFTVTPASTAANTAFAAQPRVAIQDAGGNTVTTSSAPVLLAITPPAGGATLSNCSANPRSTTSGVATFAGCRISTAGTYTLTATASGLTTAVSTSISIFGSATQLRFTTDPSDATGGLAFATQPVVTVQDAGGRTVSTNTASVLLTITTPAGATLICSTNPKNAVAGVDAFAGCKVDRPGTYTLTAATGGLVTAVSASFTVALGPASRLAFTTSPSSSTSAAAFGTQPVVTVQDAGGNTVTSSAASVDLSITTPAGATLTCTEDPKTAVSGVAAFAGCSVDKTGTYTLTAASSGLTNAVSTSFTITAGSATRLSFTTSPSSSTGGIAFGTQPVVAIQDVFGNTVTSSSAQVTLSITTPAGANLTCGSNPRAASSGVATFSSCKINLPGTYTLTAASSGLTNAVSPSFTITVGPASKLAFTTSPSSSAGGTAFATQPVVTVQDAGGNTVTSSSAPVTLSITSAGGATLTCGGNPANANNGVAAFVGCKIDRSGSYTLTAASSGLASAVSTGFTITAGTASKLAFTTSPVGSAVNTAFATQPVVTVQDAGGNTVTSSTALITLSITSGGGATLLCTANPKAAASGVATFAGCKINTAGTYTLTASASSGLTSAVSSSFTIGSAFALAAVAAHPQASPAPSTPAPNTPRPATHAPATPIRKGPAPAPTAPKTPVPAPTAPRTPASPPAAPAPATGTPAA
jgi:signal peptidase I